MVMCLIVTSLIAFPKIASAGIKDLAFSNEDASGTIEVNGGDYSDECAVITISKIYDEMHIGVNYKKVHLQNNGTAWFIYDNRLRYFNYYVGKRNVNTELDAVEIYDDKSESAYCYKTPAGEYYYLPSYEDLKNKNYVTEKVANGDIPPETPATQEPVTTNTPEPDVTNSPNPGTQTGSPAVTNSPNPNNPTGSPTVTNSPNPNNPTESPVPEISPIPSPQGPQASETNVVKSGKTVEVTQDGETIAKVTFNKKKAVATFTIEQKNNDKKVKQVKQAFVIGDSYNYGYITKKNKFVTINRETGKVKKYSGKWKKAIINENVAVQLVKLKGGKKKKISGF